MNKIAGNSNYLLKVNDFAKKNAQVKKGWQQKNTMNEITKGGEKLN